MKKEFVPKKKKGVFTIKKEEIYKFIDEQLEKRYIKLSKSS